MAGWRRLIGLTTSPTSLRTYVVWTPTCKGRRRRAPHMAGGLGSVDEDSIMLPLHVPGLTDHIISVVYTSIK